VAFEKALSGGECHVDGMSFTLERVTLLQEKTKSELKPKLQ
jgi:hypothetical protein